MQDITFVTHLRFDHVDRVNNLQIILNYYSKHFPDAKFILIEDDKHHNKIFDSIEWPTKQVKFYFIKNDGIYYRTRALNYGFKHSNTPIVISLDTDCLVSPESIKRCALQILNNCVVAWPYNGYFVDISRSFIPPLVEMDYNFNYFEPLFSQIKTKKIGSGFSIRSTNQEPMCVGGIVMFNREKFLRAGGYNENFIAWGAEDEELVIRIKKLNLECFRDEEQNSFLFHIVHSNALREIHPFYENNVKELQKIECMDKEEVKKYINTWKQYE